MFLVWFVIFLVWAFYRAYFIESEWVDELVVKPLVFVLPVFLVVKYYEKQKLASLGLFSTPKDLFPDLYIGVVIGIIFAFEGIFSNYIKNGQLSFFPAAMLASGGVLPFLFLNLFTSIWEEILGRGYLYNRLFQVNKLQFHSAFTSSFLFLLLHIPIIFTRLHLRGTSLVIYTFTTILLGITNCYIFSVRKSLTLPILIHTFWNMTVALYL